MNIKLIIAYDGSEFLGWQQTTMGPSIESQLQQAIEQILQEKIVLQAASRTDAGVHAYGQVVNFKTNKEVNLNKLHYSLNSLLPKSISVRNVEEALENFHPTLDSTGKEYHYYICYGPVQMPKDRFYSWHCPFPLEISKMRDAASYLVGKKDFSSLCNVKKNESYKDYVREVTGITIEELSEDRLRIIVTGKNFLYKMVRNIVGTLVYVGMNKIQVSDIPRILEENDRTQAGVTAPSHGLVLYKVFY